MMKKINALLITATVVMTTFELGAVKASPEPVRVEQPDGTVIEIIQYGDESSHYATTIDGHLLRLNAKGVFEIAPAGSTVKQVASTTKRGMRSNRRLAMETRSETLSREAKYRYSASAFPTIGEPHSLVFLVEYPDVRFTVENPQEYFNDFLNGEDFNRNGATGSSRQYFIENSMGAFSPTFDVYGPVMLKNNRKYYGGGNEDNAYQMVVEAVEALDEEIDFSQYDHNDDGFVDSVYVIYAHKGQADSGVAESVWPYSWELVEEGVELIADGVQFNTYGVSNELNPKGVPTGIGTFTHEFGHVLGLPDLYNTESVGDITTPGEWSVMDNGNYNNDNRTPPYFSSFERYSLGWLQPEEVLKSGEYRLPNIASSNKAYIMTTEENPDEFFIFEYRNTETGWDQYLPSHGMLVWHIDFDQEAWDENRPNNNRNHQRVFLVRADGFADRTTYVSDPFPGVLRKTEISRTTSPGLVSWAGSFLKVSEISGITEGNDGVDFKVKVDGDEDDLTGIFEIETDSQNNVYDLNGRKVGETRNGNLPQLPKGIYIMNGKKISVTR